MAEGIDRAAPFTSAEPLNCLREYGFTFIGRYYSRSDWKNLSRAEAELISSSGLWIVTVYQDANNEADYFTYDRGASDCSQAIERALAVGQPYGTPIYFAVDFEVYADDPALKQVEAYFEGVRDRMRQHEEESGSRWDLGVYGNYDTVEYISRSVGGVGYIWQTYAWSGGRVFGDYNLYQYRNDTRLASCPGAGTVDRDRCNGNGGGFRL